MDYGLQQVKIRSTLGRLSPEPVVTWAVGTELSGAIAICGSLLRIAYGVLHISSWCWGNSSKYYSVHDLWQKKDVMWYIIMSLFSYSIRSIFFWDLINLFFVSPSVLFPILWLPMLSWVPPSSFCLPGTFLPNFYKTLGLAIALMLAQRYKLTYFIRNI